MTSYTLDYTITDDAGCVWRLYDRGGSRLVAHGAESDLEGAINVADMALLAHHRRPESERP